MFFRSNDHKSVHTTIDGKAGSRYNGNQGKVIQINSGGGEFYWQFVLIHIFIIADRDTWRGLYHMPESGYITERTLLSGRETDERPGRMDCHGEGWDTENMVHGGTCSCQRTGDRSGCRRGSVWGSDTGLGVGTYAETKLYAGLWRGWHRPYCGLAYWIIKAIKKPGKNAIQIYKWSVRTHIKSCYQHERRFSHRWHSNGTYPDLKREGTIRHRDEKNAYLCS